MPAGTTEASLRAFLGLALRQAGGAAAAGEPLASLHLSGRHAFVGARSDAEALALLAWALSHRLPDLQKDEDEGDEELVGLLAADDGGVAAEDAAAMEKRRLRALVAGYAPPLTLSPAAFAAGSGSSAPEREVPPAA